MIRIFSKPAGLVRRAVVLTCAIAGWSGLCVTLASAQTLPNAGSLMKELREQDKPASVNPPNAVVAPMARPAIRFPEGTTVKVASFKVTGNTLISADELRALVKPWEGRTLDLAGLNEAAGALTRLYQSRGYILSYAYLPVQQVDDDIIEIAVLEGRIGTVQVVAAQDVRISDKVIQDHVGNATQERVAHQDALERQLLLLNEIPGVVARAAFTPGEQAGSSDLVVTVVEEPPLASSVYANNYGSSSTGEQRLGARFQLRDLFGVGDSSQWGISWAAGGGVASGSFENTLPMWGSGWSLHSGISHMTYALQGNFSDLGARGIADSAHGGVSYAAVRSASINLTARADLQYSSLRDLLGFVGVDNRKNSRSLNLGVNADAQDGWLGGGRNRAQLGVLAGTLLIETGTDSALTAGDYGKFNFDVSRDQALTQNASLSMRLASQMANRNLDSSEKLALGGPSAVRAYSSGELSVDDGALFSLDYRYQLSMLGGVLTWSAFYDYATGSVNHAALPGVTDNESSLKGVGVGVSWRASADLEIVLTAAWRGERLPTADGDKSPRLYFQISKGL